MTPRSPWPSGYQRNSRVVWTSTINANSDRYSSHPTPPALAKLRLSDNTRTSLIGPLGYGFDCPCRIRSRNQSFVTRLTKALTEFEYLRFGRTMGSFFHRLSARFAHMRTHS